MVDNLPPQKWHSVESFVSFIFGSLDERVRSLTEKRYWTLWIGAVAVAISLFADTSVRPMFLAGTDPWAEVVKLQVAHPLTPIDFEQVKALESTSHLEKIAFRISIPIIGRALHTGAASFLVLNYIAGLLFFPMLAHVANRLFQDRVSAAYVTFAFALSWAGVHFFNDYSYGDGFAWVCLLAAIYFRHPLLIFGAVLIAGFTDERAIVGSAAAFLYWLSAATTDGGDDSRRHGRAALIAIGAAWLAYFGLRLYLTYAFGLKTGTSDIFTGFLWYHANFSIPYGVLGVFQGLWLWIAVGMIALYVSGRVIILLGFVATLACVLAIALSVYDIQRSLGYGLLLLPVAWQTRGLKRATVCTLARSCFILGICLVVPARTMLRQLYQRTSAFSPLLIGMAVRRVERTSRSNNFATERRPGSSSR